MAVEHPEQFLQSYDHTALTNLYQQALANPFNAFGGYGRGPDLDDLDASGRPAWLPAGGGVSGGAGFLPGDVWGGGQSPPMPLPWSGPMTGGPWQRAQEPAPMAQTSGPASAPLGPGANAWQQGLARGGPGDWWGLQGWSALKGPPSGLSPSMAALARMGDLYGSGFGRAAARGGV